MTNITPNGTGFIALLEAFCTSGGTAPGDILARLLADHQVGEVVSLAKLVHTGQVFGFEWRGSFWIPMFQFNMADLSLAATAQTVRAELPPLWSGWTVATWFATPSAQLNGHQPVDCLASESAAVLKAAQALSSAEGATSFVLPQVQAMAAHA
ncbi:hypothetical protein [Hydrogenophaga sp.]|uniref:hypothetical protein n=1 Tax=Hydrogenophaga sp. TaxID=1904254 RepID=UPI0025C7159E|nr:hypothetical protein [Hydrogenophaga sp.]